ncbi:hypothetical protein Q3V23_36190 [Streptomyces sp. VNUA116]|uniref:hypothetical protein n=1 Tax=Streptomyces sp. VNUA116 TaxID=3062449 RepID=UPI0026774658|nr:hypothetical protein [Streptomyces sp. VNUA116]WKU49600.1 hypothetical protein Q3V23_36190 [Streptomyces sp. VNUA116]
MEPSEGNAVGHGASVSAAPPALTHGAAYAAGGWTTAENSAVEPGSELTLTLTPEAQCEAGPCAYGSVWHLVIDASSDATFLGNPDITARAATASCTTSFTVLWLNTSTNEFHYSKIYTSGNCQGA